MFELLKPEGDIQMIDFGWDGKVLFQLPVLGSSGLPMGIMTSFAIFWDKVQSGRSLSEREVASSWGFFIQTLADTFPDATRQLARLDEANMKHVIEHWVKKSEELGTFDPKAG